MSENQIIFVVVALLVTGAVMCHVGYAFGRRDEKIVQLEQRVKQGQP